MSDPTHAPTDAPSEWVMRHAALIPAGEVLDLACGSGRHARWLAARGWRVLALDRDVAALGNAAGEGITTFATDLENGAPWPFVERVFEGIVVTNYLHRPLFPAILASLAPGGILIYETFALGNAKFGKPSNPDFLLAPGELLDAVRPALQVIAYEDRYVESPKPAMVQRICARKLTDTGYVLD